MEINLERVILSNLIFNEAYGRKVAPFLKPEYFSETPDRVLFELANDYIHKYNAFPTKEALSIDLQNATGLNDDTFKSTQRTLTCLERNNETSLDYLLDQTEKWCQNRALYLGMMKAIGIMDDKTSSKGSIPQILTDALSVSFDSHIGHDYLVDAEERYEFYHKKEKKLPFDLEYLNKITGGGISIKTLSIILAGINVGKSAFMCHLAANHLAQGYKVLYITLEMAEEKIAERIDANLLDCNLDDLKLIPKETFLGRVEKLRGGTKGRLVIKEYPTTCASVVHFRHLLNELKIKKNFRPDVIYVDYINLCMSARFKHGSNVNSYSYIKAIAEELRGLAVEENLPVISATQLTRGSFRSSDVDMDDTAESFGLPATADLMLALIRTEELLELNQIMVKQLKNRYGNPHINKRFVIGVDQSKMRYYDVEQLAQEDILDGPQPQQEKRKRNPKFNKSRFQDFL